ncbi:MAG: T9SS type A sorting domain-containing protein [Bacteroidales bacterium]|nr:T9SS type A sorting domain-containing protein [Bacteroidales bacterium]
MKKFLLLLVALFATTALVKAESIAYPENPYGWQNKEDMFQAFMTDAGKSTGGLTIADFQAMAGTAESADGLHNNGLCKYLDNASAAFAMTEKWGWLKDYINEVRAAQGFGAIPGDEGAASKYEAGAFFISGQSTAWPKGADFSEAGKEENYLPKFVASYETPFTLVGTLNGWAIETAPDLTWQLDGSYKIKLGDFFGDFMIVQGHAWDGAIEYCSNGAQVNLGEEYVLANGGDNLSLSGSGYCEDCVITVRKDGESVVMTVTGTPVDEPYIIVGDYNGWKLETAAPFRVQQDGSLKTDAIEEFKGEFKVVKGRWNWNTQFSANGSTFAMEEPYTLAAGDNGNVKFASTDEVYNDVTFVLDMSGEAPILTGTAGSTVEVEATYQLMGDCTSWDFAYAPTFTKVGEGIYEYQADSFYGTFKITKNGAWAGSLCSNGNAVVVGETYYPNNDNQPNNMLIDGISEAEPLLNVKFTLNVTKADAPTLLVTGTTGAEKVAKDAVKVAVNGGVISVAGAENVAIYNAAGALVSTSAQANVPAGLYIVKAGKNVRKVIVK